MIIKVERGNSAEGLLIYQRRLDRKPEEQAGARLFALQGIRNLESAAAVLDRAAARSGRKNPIVHIILRAERALSDEDWRIAIMAALEEAGLAENAFVAVRHDHDGDDPGDHIHVATVAADRDGNPPPRFYRSTSLDRRVSAEEKEHLPRGDVQSRAWDSQLRRRLMATARRLEDDLGLRPLARNRSVLSEPVRNTVKVSQGARAREERSGTPSLADLLDVPATQAALNKPNYDERTAALGELDLKLQPFVRKNGDLAGLRLYRISDPSLHCPTSSLGGNFSLKALDRRSPVPFTEWYQGDSSATSTVTQQAADKADVLRIRYAEYTREVAARRDRLREEQLAVIAWRKLKRAKALAKRKAAVSADRKRSARVHRAAAMASYRLACAEIDAEARRQHDAIDSLRVKRLDFVDWLGIQAKNDPVAARKLAALRQRDTVSSPTVAVAVSTAPTAAPVPFSASEQAAAVAVQERLMRAADQFAEDQAVLRRREAIEALANRLDEMGVKLIVDADCQDRRVRTTDDGVLIDGVRMMPVPHRPEQLLAFTQAKMTEKVQLDEERDLPLAIRSAHGLVRHTNETPTAWLGRLYGGRHLARWLTSVQDGAIRSDWAASDEAERRRHAPSKPLQEGDAVIDRPATPHTPPLRKTIQPPAASTSPIESSPAPAASITINTPAPVATPQYGHVLDAMAMMKAQRPVALFGRSAQDMPGGAEDDAAKASEGQTRLTVPPVREAAEPVGSPQPNEADAATVPDQTSTELITQSPVYVSDPVPIPGTAPASVPRPAGPQGASDADLLARWLIAATAAEADPFRVRESEALAAQLIKQDDLAILEPEIQAQIAREADNHRRRLADEARDATVRQAFAPDIPAAPASPIAEAVKAAPSPASDTAKSADLKRAATLSHIGKINDPWQRS